MNFIAHFFLDRENPESFFAIGAATPDLLSIYNPTLRIKKHHVKDLDLNVLTEPDLILLDGVNRHFHADAVFHTSNFFHRETKWLSKQLERRLPENAVPRKYFIAHILLELILDKALIQDHPGLLEDYYRHFDDSPSEQVRLSTQKVSQHDLPNYERFLAKFRENRYLYHYQRWDHIVFVLKKIMEKVGIDEGNFTGHQEFGGLMEEFESRIRESYEQVFAEISNNEE